MIKKKGEITSSQIVKLTIFLAGVAIVFLFIGIYFFSDFFPTINQKTCKESILLRSTFNLGFGQGSQTIPLKCQTEKICLTHKKNCVEFGDFSKIFSFFRQSSIKKIKLNKDNKKAREKIIETIANSLYDCHDMVGRGKLQFMPNPYTDFNGNYCLICSRFVLENDLKNKIKNISYVELYEYMKIKKDLDGKSYLEAVYDTDSIIQMKEKLEILKNSINNENQKQGIDFRINNIDDIKIDLGKENAIIVQMMPSNMFELVAKKIGRGIGWILGVGGKSRKTNEIIYVKDVFKDYKYVYPAIYNYNLKSLKKLKCSSFETAP